MYNIIKKLIIYNLLSYTHKKVLFISKSLLYNVQTE